MNITYDNFDTRPTASVKDFAKYQLQQSLVDGQFEGLFDEHRNVLEALARLLEKLAEKGQLSAPEICEIVCGFDRQAKFGS